MVEKTKQGSVGKPSTETPKRVSTMSSMYLAGFVIVRSYPAHSMTKGLSKLFALFLFVTSCALAQFPGVAASHFAANVPEAKDFKMLLVRDLTAYLKPTLGEGLAVNYELLRDGPTQTGVAYPKFYLWITVTKSDKTRVEGAARVAAIEKTEFQITDFLSRSDIVAKPDSIDRVFPALLLDKIREKAGNSQ